MYETAKETPMYRSVLWTLRERGMTEEEMVGWHHRLDGHEFEQAPGAGDGQGTMGSQRVRHA